MIYCITGATCKENFIEQSKKLRARTRGNKQGIRHPHLRQISSKEYFYPGTFDNYSDICTNGKSVEHHPSLVSQPYKKIYIEIDLILYIYL